MTNISFNLSEKIDLVILDILKAIHQEASALGISQFVLAGIILVSGYGWLKQIFQGVVLRA